jgi:hypothetical protein
MLHLTFPHRLNRDGTYDSICTICHQTVATAKNEKDLFRHEFDHVCNPIQILQLSPTNGNC